ncbi:MAG TPA: phospholipase D family protein [Ktedonobacterales bacterium]|nr:phospholipase D family protein [Ktedonobacterales bacterium]
MSNWWAEGDTPVHADSQVAYAIDAHATFLTMCRQFLMARKYIYIAAWGITPLMKLVRGTDQRAGPDGSPEQETLLAELRAEGLQQAEIDFWCAHDLTVQAVLGYAVAKGVEVKVLVWSSSEFFSHFDPRAAQEQLAAVGVSCILDDSSHGIRHHPIESLHQKLAVIDGTRAFVGGIDMLIELSGDFDRWDTHFHHYFSPLRSNTDNATPHNWHDVHALIEGPAAADVERNFRQRWNDVIQRKEGDQQALIPEHPLPRPVESNSLIQVARTIPAHTYSFAAEDGIQGIAQLYANALSNAQRFVYLENQYFWTHAYISPFGVGVRLNWKAADSPDMERNVRELAAALQRGASVAIVLPDHPNVGRFFTDAGLARLREEAPDAAAQGRIQAFCLATSSEVAGEQDYRPIYVHAKVAIVDDLWSTVGSANLNNRGMRDDTEMNVATLNPDLAHGLRLLLWAEHLGLLHEENLVQVARYLGHQRQSPEFDTQAEALLRSLDETLGDPLVGLRLMTERAQENVRRFKAQQPLVGHLLPYLTDDEAREQGVHFHEEHGWVAKHLGFN